MSLEEQLVIALLLDIFSDHLLHTFLELTLLRLQTPTVAACFLSNPDQLLPELGRLPGLMVFTGSDCLADALIEALLKATKGI